jgi:cytochrome c551/c552
MILRIAFVLSFLLLLITAYSTPPSEEGKVIFNSRCAGCHNVNKTLVGPALAGVHERHDLDWIIRFVKSPQSMISGGDPQAVDVFEKFNRMPMPDHPDLTEEQIKSILEYVKTETSSTQVNAIFRPEKRKPAYLPVEADNYGFFFTLFGSIGLLVFVLLFFVRVKEYQRTKAME